MIRTFLPAIVVIELVVAAAHAGVVINVSNGVTIPALPGYKRFTLTAVSDGAPIQGFDFSGDPTAPIDENSRGFFGTMNQLNPAGFPTVFSDNNPLIPALFPAGYTSGEGDSQFLFKSTDLLVIPGSAKESGTSLRAAFSTTTNFGQSVDFAQLVVPVGGGISFRGVVGTTDGAEFAISNMRPPLPDIPFVNDLVLTAGSNGTVSGTVTGFAVDSWSPTLEFVGYTQNYGGNGQTGVTQPALAPTWNASTQLFSWDVTGSLVGDYAWRVTGSGNGLNDTGLISVAVNVPEPATMSLLGMGCLVIGSRRCRSF